MSHFLGFYEVPMVYLGLVYLAFHNEGHYGEAGDLVYGDCVAEEYDDNMVGDLVYGDDNMVGDLVYGDDNMVGDLVYGDDNMVGKQVCNNMTGDIYYSNNTVAVGSISH